MASENIGFVGRLLNGTGALIVLTIVVFVIVSTILGANLLGADSTQGQTVTNETSAWINETSYALNEANSSNSAYALTAIWAIEGGIYNVSVPLTNASTSAAGVVTNATIAVDGDVSLSYTYTYTFDNNYKVTADTMGTNFTEGVDNVSDKIPTILLIAAVVLLFSIIVILVLRSKDMGIGGEQGASL